MMGCPEYDSFMNSADTGSTGIKLLKTKAFSGGTRAAIQSGDYFLLFQDYLHGIITNTVIVLTLSSLPAGGPKKLKKKALPCPYGKFLKSIF